MLGNKKKIAKVPFSCNEMTDYRKSHKNMISHSTLGTCNAMLITDVTELLQVNHGHLKLDNDSTQVTK